MWEIAAIGLENCIEDNAFKLTFQLSIMTAKKENDIDSWNGSLINPKVIAFAKKFAAIVRKIKAYFK